MKRILTTAIMSLLGLLMAVITGCSGDQPTAPLIEANSDGSTVFLAPTGGEPVQFAARVATANQERSMLTFAGRSDTVIAAHNCLIVRLNNGQETPIPFVDIKPGDSMAVEGVRQQSGYVLAHQLRVCQENGGQCDLEFRDTIITVDYAAGTFMVAGRSETILVDSGTLIWGKIIVRHLGDNSQYQNREMTGGIACKENPGFYTTTSDTILTLTDLGPGDVVEIKANIIDENTLLAVSIKLANCNYKECSEFDATLAAVDARARIVTFDGLALVGVVCNGAKLTGLDGERLTLADFVAGELVAVKGFPLDGDTLRVCQMEKLPSL